MRRNPEKIHLRWNVWQVECKGWQLEWVAGGQHHDWKQVCGILHFEDGPEIIMHANFQQTFAI